MPDPDNSIVAYLAGHFDGEGNIFKRRYIRIQVGCTYKPVLELYKKYYGGNIISRNNPKGLPMWQWSIGHRLYVLRFLLSLRDHLREKRDQASRAIEYITTTEWERVP